MEVKHLAMKNQTKERTQMTFEVNEQWGKQELRRAYGYALASPDTSTQNGAIVYTAHGLIIGAGVNEFTKGMEITPDILERPKKYAFIEHAERNAVFSALDPMAGFPPRIMVAAWAACTDCARAIVQSGIQTLVRHERIDTSGRWTESIEWADHILKEGGVQIIDISGPLGGCEPVLFDGALFHP